MSDKPHPIYKRIGLFLGPVLFLAVLLMPTPEGMTVEGQRTAAVAVLMAVWWLTEALPLAGTALLPIALFPLMGVVRGTEVTREYGDANIFLFAGGFFIAMSMQKWNLHERIALNVVVRAGTNPNHLVLGFMIASAFLSLWISNTATALMMVPIAMAVIDQVEARSGGKEGAQFAVCLLLGIAYASSIGGIGTLIGTPPNIVLTAQFSELFPEAPPIGFLEWMFVGIPLVVVFLPLVWLFLTKVLFRIGDMPGTFARDSLRDRLTELGPMSRGELTVLIVASMTALSWITRGDVQFGETFTFRGWANLFPNPGMIHDSTVAIFYAAVLFVIPVNLRKGEFALDWEWARRIPWNVLLLFGGGLALARAFQDSGLVAWIGGHLEVLQGLPPILVILSIALMLTFLTELTSNTATTSIMMPILGGAAAPALGVNPLLLMIPAAISASCAFMMPVATPPNAIVFGAGRITIPQMARAGFLINLMGAVLVTLVTYFLAAPVFGIEMDVMPAWAGGSP